MKSISQRDAFFNKLYELAQKDRDIIVITADMGAPALDQWRENLPNQFINVGIAEQAMITVASGLALGGKKPYCYAITPFITGRCYDQIKTCICMMNLPVTLVGVGAGFSYSDSGPTHHGIDDVALMRVLPNMQVANARSVEDAELLARVSNKPIYIRLDRQSPARTPYIAGILGNKLWRYYPVWLKPFYFPKQLLKASLLITVEEHLLAGGFGSIVAEWLVDNNIQIPLRRIGIKDQYYYKYGDREDIWDGEAELRQILAEYRTKDGGLKEDNQGKTSGDYPARSKRRKTKKDAV